MKKVWMVSILAFCMTLMLAGCGGGNSANNEGNAGPTGSPGATDNTGNSDNGGSQEKVEISFMLWGNGPEEIKGDQAIIDEFMKQNPNIKVKTNTAPYGQYSDKLITMAAGNNMPDVLWVGDNLANFADKGLLMPLDDLIAENNISLDDWLPGGSELGTWKGKIYGLPRDLSTIDIAYNKDMFDKAGVPYPEASWTWDDFLEKAKKLTVTANGKTTQFGMASYYSTEAVIENGSSMFDYDGENPVVKFDSPEAIEAVQWVADLVNVHHVQPTGAESEGIGNMFLAGKAAMTFGGPWDWKGYTDNGKFNWDVVNVPAGKAGNKSQLLGLPIGISAKTQHKDAAWKLVEFLTHGGGQRIQSDLAGAHPSVVSALDTFDKGQYAPEHVDLIDKTMQGNTVVIKSFPQLKEANSMLAPVLDQISKGEVKAADALPGIADQIRSKLNFK